MASIGESEKNMNEDIKKLQEAIGENISTSIIYLKQRQRKTAREYVEKAESDFKNISGFSDSDWVVDNYNLIKAVRGLTYYHSLKKPSENVEYALDLIKKKQTMREIKRRLKEPIEKSSNYIDRLAHNDNAKVAASLRRFKKYINSNMNTEYDKVISIIDRSLRVCGVGKF